MYKIIFVAIENSEISHHVLKSAIELARATGVTLKLLHVLSYEDELAPGRKEKDTPEYQKRWDEFEKDGTEFLQSRLLEVKDAGVPVQSNLIPGKPGRVICDFANNWRADTIMIGRRELSTLKELILGSVSNFVVHSAPSSVLVIQG